MPYKKPERIVRSEGETVAWWPVPRSTRGIDAATAQQMIDDIIAAMSKIINSGTSEYKIGSRGLKRLSLRELRDLLDWWNQTKDDILSGSSIKSRRAMPIDQ